MELELGASYKLIHGNWNLVDETQLKLRPTSTLGIKREKIYKYDIFLLLGYTTEDIDNGSYKFTTYKLRILFNNKIYIFTANIVKDERYSLSEYIELVC